MATLDINKGAGVSADEAFANAGGVFSIKVGAFDGAIFLQEREGQDGKKFKSPSVRLQKSWTKDGQNFEVQKMGFFNVGEVIRAIYALEKVKEQLLLRNWDK